MARKTEPTERTCVVSRQQRPVGELIRFVRAPDGEVVADLRRRLPGRGVWVSAEAEMVEMAEKKRLLERAFDEPSHVTPGLAGRVDGLIQAAATSALSLARKAGNVVSGFAKVEGAIASERVVALIHAADAGADGVSKLRQALRRRYGESTPPVVRCFGPDQLDLAFGQTNVIHAAVLAGPASENLLARVRDLLRFRGYDGLVDGASGKPFDALTEVPQPARGTIGTHD